MGQVEFIFSDKTGTLTCNVMKFKQCSINGKIFDSLDKIHTTLLRQTKESDIKAAIGFFRLLAVCHTVVIDHDNKDPNTNMQAASPDELALVQGAAQVGFRFQDRTSENIQITITHL